MQQERIEIEFEDLKNIFPLLRLSKTNGEYVITGQVHFCVDYKGEYPIEDSYNIELTIPVDYPNSLPKVKEVDGKVKNTPDNHINVHDNNSFCLGSNIGCHLKFNEQPSLLGFFENLVIPFLYSYSCKREYNVMPYGELAHGPKGLIEDYKEKFSLKTVAQVFRTLYIIVFDKYKGHHNCVCGSGLKLRNCHGDIIKEMKQTKHNFKNDLYQISDYLKAKRGGK